MSRSNLFTNPTYQTNTTGWSAAQNLNKRITNSQRSTTTATITTNTDHGFLVGDSVTVAGTGNAALHGTFTVTAAPTSTTFRYTTTTTGTIASAADIGTATAFGLAPSTNTKTISNSQRTTTTALITTSAAHGFVVGDVVTIAGTTSNTPLHGTYTITTVPSSTTFTYTTSTSGTIASGADTGTAIVATTSLARITSDYFVGSSSLEITKSAQTNSGVITTDRVATTALSSYAVSGYVKVPTSAEEGSFSIKAIWYNASTAGSIVSISSNTARDLTSSSGWQRITAVFTAPATSTYANFAFIQSTAGTKAETFLLDAVLLEQSDSVEGFFVNSNQANETSKVNLALAPLPQPHLTGMKLQADISLNDFTFNTIDEYGVVWVVTDIGGWWQHPSPEIPEVSRGWGDGSYDVKGKYNARDITFEGVILTPDPSLLAAARDRFVAATNLVYTGGWLKTNEGSYIKASYVRLSGDPEIQTVNARGRTEFSIGLRAADPIKYKWNTQDPIYGYENVLIPCEATSPAADGTEIIENEGNYPVSVYLTITGPLVGPTIISNDTSEETITVTGTLRDATTKTINNRGLTDNLVTLSTSTTHGLVVGDVVTISGLGSPYDGDVVVLSVPTTSTFTYAATGSNVAYGAGSGSLAYGPDTLEINTYDRSVFLNGEYLGARAKLEVYNDWINLYPGNNTISFYDAGSAVSSTATLSVDYRSGWLA